ncbi:MAG: hypothetical protein KDA87_13195 [Planctomycetales bacterium]|nr:hypothetical protein [Planctomycetales bacterium]
MICSRIVRSTFTFAMTLIAWCGCLTGHVRSESPSAEWTKVNLSSLPSVPVPAEEDWLIHSPDRKSNLFRSEHNELVMDNGLIRRSFLFEPNLACVALDQLQTGESFLRSIRPECRIGIDGTTYDVGGLHGQPVDNFLRPQWYSQLTNHPESFQLQDVHVRPLQARFPWKARTTWMANPVAWPPAGMEVRFDFAAPTAANSIRNVNVSVHYELYDGLPLLCKWLTVTNASGRTIRINHFTSEILACVEASSQVEDLAEPLYPNLHIETDFTSCSMHGASAQRDSVYWLPDPSYQTQVNYRLESKCLLECRPPQGPEVDVANGDTFVSFRTWILANENRDEDRQSLALGRMYKTISPWVTENPLIHHVRSANPDAVRLAIDQSAEVGFELVIMTFGSGFQIENESPEYLAEVKKLADYAHSKAVALGGYSLLASRSIDAQNDVINPETGKPGGFARFGNSPCLESEWGQDYFRKLYQFYEKTGCDVLEHDGSYPGDACASHDHPGHRGYEDSRWRQWQTISQFYQWCRGRGIYLNVPDWYFMHGSSKNGMGYRETNWSLNRDYQEIIERQNIHDGTRFKLPTMGWMFVPLTEYHGGGAAATIEPLHEHLDHYERRLQNLLGAGVQACFRGPRIYDTEETKQMVKRWVDFYKQRRAILDSSLLPLRRADGRDWDGWLHVNPSLETPALAMIYNPLDREIEREIRIPLYYSGLSKMASVRIADGARQELPLDRNETVRMKVSLPAKSAIWVEFSAAAPSK